MAFIKTIRERNRIHLVPFDKTVWFKGAYSTVARTLRTPRRPMRSGEKTTCIEFVFNGLSGMNVNTLNSDWRKLIESLVREFPESLCVGTAQKITSILCKYLYAIWRVCPDKLPEPWRRLIEIIYTMCPIPIDRIVIGKLQENYPQDFPDLQRSTIIQNGKPVAWSKLTDYNVYWSLQERIRTLAENANLTPIEFEARCLWRPSPKDKGYQRGQEDYC